MKITCITEKLREIISSIDRLTAKHPSLPTLGYILCTVSKNSISFRATNLSIGAEGTIQGRDGEDGSVAIEGKSFLQALGGDSNSETTLTLKDDVLTITSGKYKTTLKTFSQEDFPTLPQIQGTTITTPSSVLLEGINSVVYAASMSDIKPEIASVYIYPEENNLVFVATDTFRLAEKKIKITDIYGFSPILIPAKNALEIARILSTLDQIISISFSENQITISGKGIYITSRITQGSFPNYHQIIPKEFSTTATFLNKDLEETLKSLTSFSDKFNQVTITITPKDKECVFEAKNGEKGEQLAVIDGAFTGEKVSFNVNARYILDILGVSKTDSLSFNIFGQQKPIVINPIGDTSFLYLVMPINRS
jgi:DNA polymerase-3 subunit beta